MFFKKKNLDLHLNGRKIIKIKGFNFIIRKLNPLDYMSNDKILLKLYDVYENKNNAGVTDVNFQKIIDHYKQVLCAGIVNPKILFKGTPGENEILIDDLMRDWEICESLYAEIMTYTIGKKKVRLII